MMDFSEFATKSEKDDSLWTGDKISLILNSPAQMATFETFVRTLENTRQLSEGLWHLLNMNMMFKVEP